MPKTTKKNAFLLPVRILIDAEGPAEAFAAACKYLNQNDIDNPIADATVEQPIQLPERIDAAIHAGTYRDGDAARWHDQVLACEQAKATC